MDEFCGFDCLGADELGEQILVVPTVGANYTDAKTVTAVQYALVKRGYNIGATGPQSDGVDGILGPKTAKAIKKLQSTIGAEQTGKIDEFVVRELRVTPGVLPPGVTTAGRAAVQAQVALDAATKAERASTPTDVQIVAKELADAMVFEPVEIRLPVEKALAKAKAATTPAQVADAAKDVKAAALAANAAVKPSWWTTPAWSGGLERRYVVAIGAGGAVGLGALLTWILSSGTKAVR